MKKKRTRRRIDWRSRIATLPKPDRSLLLALVLLILALVLRLLVIPAREVLEVAPLIGDEGNYLGIAQSLAAGDGVPNRWIWLRPPGYPLLLAAMLRLSGNDLHALLLMQVGFGLVTVAVSGLLAYLLWGRQSMLGVLAWVALDPSVLYTTRVLQTETVYTTFQTIAAVCLVRWGQTTRHLWLLLGALSAGLAALVRPTIVAAVPLLLGWLVWQGWQQQGWRAKLRPALVFLGLWLLTISPATIHNWLNYQRLIPLDTTMGYTLWRDHRDDTLDDITTTLMAIPNPGDRQQFAFQQGLRWMQQHPGETMLRGLHAVQFQWGVSLYADEGISTRPGSPDTWRSAYGVIALLSWLVLLLLLIVGLVRAPHLGQIMPLVMLGMVGPTLGVFLTHPDPRFLLPSLPLLAVLAGGAFQQPWRTFVTSRRLPIALACCALYALIVWPIVTYHLGEWGRPTMLMLQGQLAEAAGNPTQAAQYYRRAANEPRTPSEPHLRLALLALQQGDQATAAQEAQRALDRDQDNYRARAILAFLLRDQGRTAEIGPLLAKNAATAPGLLTWTWQYWQGPPPSRLLLDGSDIGFVQGCFGLEVGQGSPFRWAGDRAQFRLTPPSTAPLQLNLRLASPLPVTEPLFVTVVVDGQTIGTATVLRKYGWNLIQLPLLTQRTTTKPVLIELRSPITRTLPDWRGLGVAVSEVWLSEATATGTTLPGAAAVSR